MNKLTLDESLNTLLELVYMYKGSFIESVLYLESRALYDNELHLEVFKLVQDECSTELKELFVGSYRQHLFNVVHCIRKDLETRMDFEDAIDLVKEALDYEG